jgi:Fic family protein
MRFNDILQNIEENQERISSYDKFDDAILKKINYKLRLDWNYYSNRMEGGTLTKAETRSVMVGNIDVKGKPFKDVAEMTGHDKIVLEVLKMSKGELSISEKRIKEIHKAIMYEEDAEKAFQIGKWKSEPNEIINYKGEKISFTQPSEVGVELHKLIGCANAELDKYYAGKKSKHPVEIAAQFHIDFVSVHPFYDGNGRTTRVLTNILLMACGYPTIIIKDEYKKAYYKLLGDIQAYGGNTDLFYEFIAERVLDTQQLILDAIEGKDIDEPDDIDKKIALLEKELEAVDPNEEVKYRLSREVFVNIFQGWLGDLIKAAVPEIQKFNRFFTGTSHWISLANNLAYTQFIDESPSELIERLNQQFHNDGRNFQDHETSVRINTQYGTLTKGGLKTFGCNYSIEIKFDTIKYEVYVDEFKEDSAHRTQAKLFERLLHKPLTEAEIKKVVTQLTNAIFDHIDYNTKKSGLR